MTTAPVVLILFNRPDFTAASLERIAEARPNRLLLIADGPRSERERPLCDAAREVVARITWPCDVRRNYSASNLGCYERVVSGLNWVFQQVESAIILEDDMLPDETLFPFVTELLAHYSADERVFTISGMTPEPYSSNCGASYSFSRYPLTWGWGTWARAWRHYDGRLADWPELRKTNWLRRVLDNDPDACDFYRILFDAAGHADQPGHYRTPWGPALVDAWDYQWHYTMWRHEAVSIVPSVSLVRNQGFRFDSTNVSDPDSHLAAIPQQRMRFPLVHPSSQEISCARDAALFLNWQRWRRLSRWQRLRFQVSRVPWLRNAYRTLWSAKA